MWGVTEGKSVSRVFSFTDMYCRRAPEGGGGSTEGKSERTGHQRVPTVFHFNGMDLFRVEGSELRGRVETEGSGVPCSQGTANPSRTPLGPKAPAYGRVLGGGGGFL